MKVTTCSKEPILAPCNLENFNFQLDPYLGCGHLCHYCYALIQAETDWTEEIRIYEDISAQLRSELKKIPPPKI
jgi:DNA repair photolyase